MLTHQRVNAQIHRFELIQSQGLAAGFVIRYPVYAVVLCVSVNDVEWNVFGPHVC